MEQVEALTVLDSEVYVGYFSENLNNDFVICSDSIMQGGVSLGILQEDTKAQYGLPTSGCQMEQLTLRDSSRQDILSLGRTNSRPNITGIHSCFIAFVKSFPQGLKPAAEQTAANIPN